MFNRVYYAVSDVIALLFVLVIVSTSVGFILLWGTPYIDEKKAQNLKESALTQFSMITDIIKDDVIGQGFQSRKTVEFRTDSGHINLDSESDRFVLYYSLDQSFDFNVSGFEDSDEFSFNFDVESGSADSIRIYYLYREDNFFEDKDNDYSEGTTYTIDNLQYPSHDAVQMDISEGADIIGRIWLFDTGSIQYETSSNSGLYYVIIENGAVLSNQNNYGFLYHEPTILKNDDVLVIRIIQLKSSSVLSASGRLQCRLTIKLNNSYLREDEAKVPVYLKMQVFGDVASMRAWTNYFISPATLGFSQFPDGTLYLKPEGGMNFSLTHSICDVSMRVVG